LRASLRLFNFVPTKLSMPLATRLESSKRCYWLCQTSGWNEWAGTTPATAPARLNWVRYSHKSQKAKKPKSQKAKKIIPAAGRKNLFRLLLFFRPNRASPPLKKAGSHARRDAGQGSWYRRYLTIRGRWRNFSARISWNAGQRGL